MILVLELNIVLFSQTPSVIWWLPHWSFKDGLLAVVPLITQPVTLSNSLHALCIFYSPSAVWWLLHCSSNDSMLAEVPLVTHSINLLYLTLYSLYSLIPQCRLMTTSLALQRWMACWILLILSWSLVYLLYWISHEASIIDMLKFCLPLFLLPLVCSGVTEVNSEGQRVSRVSK